MSWNIHPGEILLEEFMRPNQLTSNKLANLLGIPSPRINDVVLGKRGITADTALRLAHYFGTTAKFWMNLQNSYEIRKISQKTKNMINSLSAHNFLSPNIS